MTKINEQEFAHPNPEILKNHKNPLIREIYETIYVKNRNCLVVIVGKFGGGKTYIGNKICSEIDPEGYNYKTIRKRCVTKPKDFIEKVIDSEKDLKFGSALQIDELGTVAPSREWHSFNNKAMDYIIQTFRYKKLLVVFTVAELSLVDTHLRKFFNFYVEALEVNSKNQNVCKVMRMSYSPKTGNVYYIYPRYKMNGKRVCVKKFRLDRCDIKLCNEYEKYASEFKQAIVLDLKKQSDKIAIKEIKKNIDVEKIANDIMLNKERYIKIYPRGASVNKGLIETDFAVGGGYSLRIKRLVEQRLKEEAKSSVKPTIVLRDILPLHEDVK